MSLGVCCFVMQCIKVPENDITIKDTTQNQSSLHKSTKEYDINIDQPMKDVSNQSLLENESNKSPSHITETKASHKKPKQNIPISTPTVTINPSSQCKLYTIQY